MYIIIIILSFFMSRCMGAVMFGLGWVSLEVFHSAVLRFLACISPDVSFIKSEDSFNSLFKVIFYLVSWIKSLVNII